MFMPPQQEVLSRYINLSKSQKSRTKRSSANLQTRDNLCSTIHNTKLLVYKHNGQNKEKNKNLTNNLTRNPKRFKFEAPTTLTLC